MPDEPSPAERRVDSLGRDVFDRAVAQAAGIATQNVAAIHRKRLVLQSFLAALVVSSMVGIGLVLAFHALEARQSRADALYNCNLVRGLTSAMGDFVATDAHLQIRQQHLSVSDKINKAFGRLLGASTLQKAQAEYDRYNAETTHFWLVSVVPRLDAIAGVNCSTHIR